MKRTVHFLENKIAKIKAEIIALGDVRPGSLSEQYNVCGTPGCRCKANPSKKHGPYVQLSYTRHGRSHTQFVRRGEMQTVKAQIKNYSRLRHLVDQWVELATELSVLRLGDHRQH